MTTPTNRDPRDLTAQISTARISRRGLLTGAVLLAGGGIALAGCTSTDEPATPIATNSAGYPDFTGTTLQVWSGATVAAPAEKAAQAWSRLTGGKVVVTAIPFAERSIKFAGLVSAQDASVDLLYAASAFVGRFGDRLYLDLSDRALGVDTSAYVPASLRVLTTNNGLRGLPVHSEMMVYIYNKRMFAAAGLDPEKPPTTWNELFDKAKGLQSGTRFGCAIPWTTSIGAGAYYLIFLNSIPGAKLLSDDRTQVLFDGDEGREAFETIERGMKAGFFSPALGRDVEDYATGKMFNAGNAASIINFAELWGYAIGASPTDFPTTLSPADVGVSVVPGVRAGASGSVNGFEGFGISKFSKRKEASLSFLRYLTGSEFQKEMNLGKTLPSSNKAVLESAEVKAVYPIGPVIAAQGETNLDRYSSPYDWEPPINDALRRLYNGEVSAAEAHRSAVDGVRKIVQDHIANG